jgi:acetoin:2,6-dichlorophenolindophenol oxidoreductase subunit alpha
MVIEAVQSWEPSEGAGPTDEQLRWIFETAVLTRTFEARVVRLAKEGFLSPLLHPGAGQEVSQLAALAALNRDDPLLYGHRGVAYLVGRGILLEVMLADMAGREGGTSNGKGGIMHIADIAKGVYGQSGTLGGGFVIAIGIAMALKKMKRPQLVVHFFGDGTANRGTFHESLNWCALQKLPAIFICENNGWAVSVPTSESTSVRDIAVRAAGYGIPGAVVDGGNPDEVYRAVSSAADRVRSGGGPTLIEVKNIRLLGHYATDPQDYRADRETVAQADPLLQLRERLVAERLSTDAALAQVEQEAMARVEAAVEAIRKAPILDGDLAFTDLYA